MPRQTLEELPRIAAAFESLRAAHVERLRDGHLARSLGEFAAFTRARRYDLDSAAYTKPHGGGGGGGGGSGGGENADSAPLADELVRVVLRQPTLCKCAAAMTDGALGALQQSLATSVADTLSDAISGAATGELRAQRPQRFSEWGALALHKDVRLLQTRLSEVRGGQGRFRRGWGGLRALVQRIRIPAVPNGVRDAGLIAPTRLALAQIRFASLFLAGVWFAVTLRALSSRRPGRRGRGAARAHS